MLKVISLFSGIGGYEQALKNLGIEFETINYCEFDKITSKCYELIHGPVDNLNDITKIDAKNLPKIDLLVFSPPCQDISVAGQQAGINEHTRTGLMWEAVDVLKETQPTYFVMENVATLAGKYKDVLLDYVDVITKLGYQCEWDVLNAKDYGIPQNRRRLFLIGSKKGKPKLPDPIPLQKALKDYLDTDVQTIDKDIAYTIRLGGRRSKIGNKHNWDGYMVNGQPYYLSAKECLKLMGFTDEHYFKLKDGGIAESKIAKVAGNSICLSVLEEIFKELLK